MLWLIIGAMMFVAVLAVAIPIYREERRLSSMPLLSVVAAIAISPIVYLKIGAVGRKKSIGVVRLPIGTHDAARQEPVSIRDAWPVFSISP